MINTIQHMDLERFTRSCNAYELNTDTALELAQVFLAEKGRLPENYLEALEVLE